MTKMLMVLAMAWCAAAPNAAAAQATNLDGGWLDLFTIHPDANGVCHAIGRLPPLGDSVALCLLGHAEATTLTASVETGSLNVIGWTLRASPRWVLIGLRNVRDRYVDVNTEIRLGRMVPATPLLRPPPVSERCVLEAIAANIDPVACDLWKDTQKETPAVAAAGVDD